MVTTFIVYLVIGYVLTSVLRIAIPFGMVMLAAPAEKPKAVESSEPKPAYYDCIVSTERVLEERLVTAGLMKNVEMTMCEDMSCPNCQPTRDAIRFVERERRREERIAFETAKAARELNAPKRAPHTINLYGRQMPIPDMVSPRAVATVQSRRAFDFTIEWSWKEGGQIYVIRQDVDRKFFDSLPRVASEPPTMTRRSYPTPPKGKGGGSGFPGNYPNQSIMNELKLELERNNAKISELENRLEKMFALKAKSYKHGEVKDLHEVEIDQLLDSPIRFSSCGCREHEGWGIPACEEHSFS